MLPAAANARIKPAVCLQCLYIFDGLTGRG